jgi:hypothetical protein
MAAFAVVMWAMVVRAKAALLFAMLATAAARKPMISFAKNKPSNIAQVPLELI